MLVVNVVVVVSAALIDPPARPCSSYRAFLRQLREKKKKKIARFLIWTKKKKALCRAFFPLVLLAEGQSASLCLRGRRPRWHRGGRGVVEESGPTDPGAPGSGNWEWGVGRGVGGGSGLLQNPRSGVNPGAFDPGGLSLDLPSHLHARARTHSASIPGHNTHIHTLSPWRDPGTASL